MNNVGSNKKGRPARRQFRLQAKHALLPVATLRSTRAAPRDIPAIAFIYGGHVYKHESSVFFSPANCNFSRVGSSNVPVGSRTVATTPCPRPDDVPPWLYIAHRHWNPVLTPGVYAFAGRPTFDTPTHKAEAVYRMPDHFDPFPDTSSDSSLNGTHGEATNEDDMEREGCAHTLLEKWAVLHSRPFLNDSDAGLYEFLRQRLSTHPLYAPVVSHHRLVQLTRDCHVPTTVRDPRISTAPIGSPPCVTDPLHYHVQRFQRYVAYAIIDHPDRFVRHLVGLTTLISTGFSVYGYLHGWSYAFIVFCNTLGLVASFFVVISQLNGTHGEATNEDDLASVVISSQGKHKFKISNDNDSRREELVHASPKNIRRVISAKPKIRYNTKKLKSSAEKLEKRQKDTSRDLERCEKEFRLLMSEIAPNFNQPQLGFSMGELLSKYGVNPMDFIRSCNTAMDLVKKTSTSVNSVAGFVAEAIDWLPLFARASLLCVFGAVLIYAIQSKNRLLAILSGSMLGVYGSFVAYKFCPTTQNLLDNLLKYLPSQAPPPPPKNVYIEPEDSAFPNKPEGDPVIPLDQATINKIMVSVFSCGFFAFSDPKKTHMDRIKDYVVHFPSITKGLDGIIEFASKFVLVMLNKFRSSLSLPAYESLLDNQTPFLQWMTDTELFLDNISSGKIPPSAGTYGQLNTFIEQGHGHTKFFRSISDDRNGLNRISSVMVKLQEERCKLVSFNANTVSYRAEPVCVVLYGKPGRGKTVLALMIAQAYAQAVLPPEAYKLFEKNMAAYIYNRTPETQFWDGYANQLICIVDDFLQKREVAGGDSAALDIIRSINGAPALLHMASLNDKGRAYFTSELVLMTTNVEVPHSEAIECIDAVCRRPNIWISVDYQPKLYKEYDGLSAKTLGGTDIDSVALNVINAAKTWEDRASVYVMNTYSISEQRQPVPGKRIYPRELINWILQRKQVNTAKFNHVLPECSLEDKKRATELLMHFRSQEGSKPDTEPFEELKPPQPNKPEGNFGFSDLATVTKEDLQLQAVNFAKYLSAIEQYGPTSEQAEAFKELIVNVLDKYDYSWTQFEVDYWPNIMVAKSEYLKLEQTRLAQSAAMIRSLTLTTDALKARQVEKDASQLSNRDYFFIWTDLVNKAIRNGASWVWNLLRTHWKVVIGIAGFVGVSLGTWRLLSSWETNEAQSLSVKTRVANRRQHKVPLKFRQAPMAAAVPQGYDQMEEQAFSVLGDVYAIMWTPEAGEAIGHITMIVDRVGVLPYHTIDMIAAKVKSSNITHVWLQGSGKLEHRTQVPVDRFTRAQREWYTEHLDGALVYLNGCSIAQAKNRLDNIPDEEAWDSHSQCVVLMPRLKKNTERWSFHFDQRAYIHHPIPGYQLPEELGGHSYTNAWNVSYLAETGPGHCGMPGIVDGLGQGKYLGIIHKCNNGKFAGGFPLVKEWVELELAKLKKEFPDIKIILHKDTTKFDQPNTAQGLFPQCYPARTEGIAPAFHGVTDSKLVMLPHAELFELNAQPAVLDTVKVDGHYINPYIKNREKFPEHLLAYPDVPHLNRLVSSIINDVTAKDPTDSKMWRRLMTFEEAVFGIPDTVFGSLDMTTSVGYDWTLNGPSSKGPWINDPVRFAKVREVVEAKVKLLRLGYRPLFYHMDVLKDERRSIEKVLSCSTRVVVVGPLDLLIINRMFFGGFASWTQLNKIENGITIGMNPYSLEWDAMCKKLFVSEFKRYAGDSEGFDLKQHQEPLRAIFGGINDWYGNEEDGKVRDILSIEFMCPRHLTFPVTVGPDVKAELLKEPVPDNPYKVSHYLKIVNASDNRKYCFVYVVVTGHPSGSYLTALINSWYSLVKPYIVIQFHLRNIEQTLDIFYRRGVRSMTLGDDFITAVHSTVQPILNAQTFAEFSMKYGMRVTREDKTPITEPFPAEDPIFLKRLLRRDPEIGRWVGALQQTAIIDAMCWMRKSGGRYPTDSEYRDQFRGALLEFSLWGRDVYKAARVKVREASIISLGHPYDPLPTWEDAIAEVTHDDRVRIWRGQ